MFAFYLIFNILLLAPGLAREALKYKFFFIWEVAVSRLALRNVPFAHFVVNLIEQVFVTQGFIVVGNL